jgi:hypothetical protein
MMTISDKGAPYMDQPDASEAVPQTDVFPEIAPVANTPVFGEYSRALASLTHSAHLAKGYVEAIAIDYADGDYFTLRAASIAGGYHRRKRTVRQDSFAVAEPIEGVVVVAVGDGVGGFDYSHFAATWACQAACKLLSDEMARCPDVTVLRPDAVLSPINDGLFALQTALTVDFATTLVLCVISHGETDTAQVWLARIGDSTAVTLFQTPDGTPQWRFLFGDQAAAQDGIATTKTKALPTQHLTYEHKRIELPRDTALFLLTDGIRIPLEISESVREGLGRQWLTPPAPLDFASYVRFNRRGEVDDRTVVGVWMRP